MKKISFLLSVFLAACTPSQSPTANQVIEKSIAAHGWNKQEFKLVFDFRAYQYELVRKHGFYSYQRTTTKEGVSFRDVLTSETKLERFEGISPVTTQRVISEQ